MSEGSGGGGGEGLPEGLVAVDLGEATVTVTVDGELYPRDAIYGAAYVFIDRCWVLLDRPSEGRVSIALTAKAGASDEATLQALAGELANELLSCVWRHEITKHNRGLLEAVTAQAFAGAMGPPTLDELEAFDFSDEPFEDPLGIAQSWEAKHGRDPKAQAEAPAKDAAEAEAKDEGPP